MPRTTHARLLAACLTFAVLATACGGDDGTSPASPTAVATSAGPTTTAAPATTAAPTTTRASGLAAALLVAGDLAAGWTEGSPPAIDLQSLCYGDAPLPLATAASKQFSKDGRSISNTVVLFSREEDASKVVARAQDTSVLDCLREKLEGVVNPGGASASKVVAATVPAPRYGDETVGLRLSVVVGAVTLTNVEALLVRVGRLGAVFQMSGPTTAIDAASPDAVVTAVVARLRSIDAAAVPTTTASR